MDEIKDRLTPKFFRLPLPLPQEQGEILEQAYSKACTEVKHNVMVTLDRFRRPDDLTP
jgi:hypothetical protein